MTSTIAKRLIEEATEIELPAGFEDIAALAEKLGAEHYVVQNNQEVVFGFPTSQNVEEFIAQVSDMAHDVQKIQNRSVLVQIGGSDE